MDRHMIKEIELHINKNIRSNRRFNPIIITQFLSNYLAVDYKTQTYINDENNTISIKVLFNKLISLNNANILTREISYLSGRIDINNISA